MKRIFLLCLLVTGCRHHERAPKRMGDNPSSNTIAWLDVQTPQTAGVLPALERHFDAAFGFPTHYTLHDRVSQPHPTQAGRFAMPLNARAASSLSALVASCDGVGTGPCTAILALSSPVATLDSSWDALCDGGCAATPTDDWPGQTP